MEFTALTRDQIFELEPQLSKLGTTLVGGIQFPKDNIGDSRLYTQAVAKIGHSKGGEIRLGETVARILTHDQQVIGVELDSGEVIETPTVVVATGVHAQDLLTPLGLKIAVAPAKGYSLTFDVAGLGNIRPRVTVIDDAMHAAIVPLGDRLRIVGTAEFAGRDTKLNAARIENLKTLFQRVYPEIAAKLDLSSGTAWTGLRPMSADGRPTIGKTPIDGLWVNVGHGHLGWTNAMGAARVLVDQFQGETPEIDVVPFRFGRT